MNQTDRYEAEMRKEMRRVKMERGVLFEALKRVLASAHPNEKEHPAMFGAWRAGEAALQKVGRV